jgi:hypothetical protein
MLFSLCMDFMHFIQRVHNKIEVIHDVKLF